MYFSRLLCLIISCTLISPAIYADEDDSEDIDGVDVVDDYDLYDRNQDQADFNPYNFPDDENPNNTNSMFYPES